MTGPRAKPARTGAENVLDGLSERMRGAMVITNFRPERAQRLEKLSLMDVALHGAHAARRRGGKK